MRLTTSLDNTMTVILSTHSSRNSTCKLRSTVSFTNGGVPSADDQQQQQQQQSSGSMTADADNRLRPEIASSISSSSSSGSDACGVEVDDNDDEEGDELFCRLLRSSASRSRRRAMNYIDVNNVGASKKSRLSSSSSTSSISGDGCTVSSGFISCCNCLRFFAIALFVAALCAVLVRIIITSSSPPSLSLSSSLSSSQVLHHRQTDSAAVDERRPPDVNSRHQTSRQTGTSAVVRHRQSGDTTTTNCRQNCPPRSSTTRRVCTSYMTDECGICLSPIDAGRLKTTGRVGSPRSSPGRLRLAIEHDSMSAGTRLTADTRRLIQSVPGPSLDRRGILGALPALSDMQRGLGIAGSIGQLGDIGLGKLTGLLATIVDRQDGEGLLVVDPFNESRSNHVDDGGHGGTLAAGDSLSRFDQFSATARLFDLDVISSSASSAPVSSSSAAAAADAVFVHRGSWSDWDSIGDSLSTWSLPQFRVVVVQATSNDDTLLLSARIDLAVCLLRDGGLIVIDTSSSSVDVAETLVSGFVERHGPEVIAPLVRIDNTLYVTTTNWRRAYIEHVRDWLVRYHVIDDDDVHKSAESERVVQYYMH